MTIVNILIALLVLNIMVVIHEFGHYITGRLLKFTIKEFAVGFGPRLFGWERKGIKYSFRLLPLGGYCAFLGEDDGGASEDPGAMNNRPWYYRLIVLVSGAGFNIVSAILAGVLFFSIVGSPVISLTSVSAGTPAAQAQLQAGDQITGINGRHINQYNELATQLFLAGEGGKITLQVQREGKPVEVATTLAKLTDEKGESYVGLGIKLESKAEKVGFFRAIGMSFQSAGYMAADIVVVLGQLLTGKMGLSSLSGPISTIGVMSDAVGQSASFGFMSLLLTLLNLFILLSMNLAVFNLLPIPALDGARMVFTLIEGIRKKPINRELEAKIHAGGFMVLIGFVIVLEISKLFI